MQTFHSNVRVSIAIYTQTHICPRIYICMYISIWGSGGGCGDGFYSRIVRNCEFRGACGDPGGNLLDDRQLRRHFLCPGNPWTDFIRYMYILLLALQISPRKRNRKGKEKKNSHGDKIIVMYICACTACN